MVVPAAVPPEAVPPRILLLDDDPALRRLLARLLTKVGYDVCEASDTAAAVAELRNTGTDLVVVNLSTDEEGHRAIRSLRTSYSELRILVLSETVDSVESSEKLRLLPKLSRAVALVQNVREMMSGESPAKSQSSAALGGRG